MFLKLQKLFESIKKCKNLLRPFNDASLSHKTKTSQNSTNQRNQDRGKNPNIKYQEK